MPRKFVIEKIKELLIAQRDAIESALEGDDNLLKGLSGTSGGDIADMACESTHGEISSQLLEVSHDQLNQIDQALHKMKDGSYGKCGVCNCKIPAARLEALPYAIFCIKCQLAYEESGTENRHTVDWSILLDSADPPANLHFKVN